MQQVSAHMASYFDLSSLLPRSEMTTFPLNVKSGYSVWLGALARIDFVNGDDKHLTFVVPTDVTIHRTPITRAETVFIDQAGNLLKPSYFIRQPDSQTDLDAKDTDALSWNQQKALEIHQQFVKHEITLNCTDYKKANYDIVVEGLGWISV